MEVPFSVYMAISERIGSYSYSWDSKDMEAFRALFTADAVWEMFSPGQSSPDLRVEGRDDILNTAEAIHTGTGRLAGIQTRLFQTNLTFQKCGADTTQTKVMMMLVTYPPGESLKVVSTGIYEDDWLNTSDGWLFSHRRLYTDGPLE